ncbi:MAG: hypothetical protein HOV83_35065 [Catenulispora sp.]|nr:hypothetical protein [Catenulispora sp.]
MATPSFALPTGFTTLAAAGLGHRPAFVEQPCDRGQTLLLQIARRDERTGTDTGFRVHYTSAGYAYTVDLPFVMILCAPGDTATEHCA